MSRETNSATDSNRVVKTRLKVPFYSQQLGSYWQESGFSDKETALRWAPRACGIVCLKSVISALAEREVPNISDLLHRVRNSGGFKRGVGWIHRALAEEARRYGIKATTWRVTCLQQLTERLLENDLALASVAVGFEGGKGGHLVVVKGFCTSSKSEIGWLLIDHPSSEESYEHQDLWIEGEKFLDHFSGNIIVFRRKERPNESGTYRWRIEERAALD